MKRRCGTCPSCKQSGAFEYLGDQHWPPEVAARLNMPPVLTLWSCPNCKTTVSETEMLPLVVRLTAGDEDESFPLPADLFKLNQPQDSDC